MVSLEKLLSLFDCETAQEWTDTLFEIAGDSGFEHTLFGMIQNKETSFEAAFIKSNYPEQWRRTYDKMCFHYIDPVVAHCLVSSLPMMWSARTFRGEVQQQFYEQACGYGLRSGISYPVHGADGEFGMLSFVSSDNDHAAYGGQYEALTRLSLIRDYAVESSIRFLQEETIEPVVQTRLTPRELECVKWIMAGKSSWEISQILRCSEATINFHVANLKKKFNVQTRQQAVVKAIKERLIMPA